MKNTQQMRITIIFISIFFILVNVRARAETAILYVDGFTGVLTEWDTEDPPSPYLHNNTDSWIHEAKTSGAEEGYFTFENITGAGSITGVWLYIECYGDDTNEKVEIWGDLVGEITVNQNSYDWELLNVTWQIGSVLELNNTDVFLTYQGVAGGDDVYLRRMYLNVTYNPPGLNNAPVNDDLTINLDDSDNLYAEKKYYNFDYDAHDPDGYADIDYIKIFINQSGVSRAIFRYDEDTNVFARLSGNWELDTGGSSYTKSGDNLNVTFKIFPSWDAIEEGDLEFEALIFDDEPESDRDILRSDYADVITTLLPDTLECTDPDTPDRVPYGINQTFNYQIYYANDPGSGTVSDDYPPDSEFNFIAIYDALNNEMVRDTSVTNGGGSMLFNESAVKLEVYNLYVDLDDTDFTDQELTGLTESVIWDRGIVGFSMNETSPVNASQSVTFTMTFYYEYDDLNSTNFDVDINRNATLYLDDYSLFNFNESYSGITYEYDIIVVVLNEYGINVFVDPSNLKMKWLSAPVPDIGEITLFHGSGFNASDPWINLQWNYSGAVDNFQIIVSTDNITYVTLVLTPNQEYNHTGLTNGTYRYYRVRSTYFDSPTWYNSSYSPINLERVFYVLGTGGAGPAVSSIALGIILLLAGLLFGMRLDI